jgi:GT2 family glycosyltransferase
LEVCITSILNKTTYSNYEIIIVDNNSDDPATLQYLRFLSANPKIKVIRDSGGFNYSRINNQAVNVANGSYIALLNNDVEVITPEWLTCMLSHAARDEIGAVGAKLWYPDNTIQHAGLILGVGGVANSAHHRFRRGQQDYFSKSNLTQSVSAVTAACLVVKKSVYEQVGGLDEENLQIAFNDVDFCLKILELGLRNIFAPFAELYHHESASRGYDTTQQKQLRLANEEAYMWKRWGHILRNDPAYNPNLSSEQANFSLAFPPRI